MNAQEVDSQEASAEELEEFRNQLRTWLKANMPAAPHARYAEEQMLSDGLRARELMAILNDGGYSGICVPREYGGAGLTRAHHRIFLEESLPFEMPVLFNTPTLTICAPTLLDFGTEEQKRRHLPRMLSGEELWVQMLSEPSGGSDLAGVLTRGERREDGWILNGSKIWTTGAHRADFGLCLARTDWSVPKHDGLSMFIVPMKDPNMDVRTIRMVNGSIEFCEEFLTDVPLSDEALVGSAEGGWTVTQRLLTHERDGTTGGSPYAVGVRMTNDGGPRTSVLELAQALGRSQDPHVQELVAEAWVNDVVQAQLMAHLTRQVATGQATGPVSALSRLFHAQVHERAIDIELEVAGSAAAAWLNEDIGAVQGIEFLMRQARSLGGGSNEMQRNIISERLLGMPREPAADRGVPFKDVRKNAVRTADRP